MRPRNYPVHGSHGAVTVTLNIHFDKYPPHARFQLFMSYIERWKKQACDKYKDFGIHDVLFNYSPARPIFQIFFAYREFTADMTEDCLDAVERGVNEELPPEFANIKIVGVDIEPFPRNLS